MNDNQSKNGDIGEHKSNSTASSNSNQGCIYAGQKYPDGTKMDQAGDAMICRNGTWIEDTTSSNSTKSCIYDGKEYPDGTKMDQAGDAMICKNGTWIEDTTSK